MSRKEFEIIVAAAPREKLMSTQITQPVSVPASGSTRIDVFSPSGSIGRVQSLYIGLPLPTGATTGAYGVTIGSTSFSGSFISGDLPYNKGLVYNQFGFGNSSDFTAIYPIADMVSALKDIHFDDVIGLYLLVRNNTNGTISGNVTFLVNWIKREVG